MRRWLQRLSGRRLVTISVVLTALAAGTALLRVDTPAEQAAEPTTAVTAPPDTAAFDDSTLPSLPAPTSTVDPTALDVPVDPSGARRDRSLGGARRAGLDYLSTVRQRVVYLSAADAETVVRDWAAAGVAEAVVVAELAKIAGFRDALAAPQGQVWWAVAPLAVRVDGYTPDRARVSVWFVSVHASGAGAGNDQAVAPVARYQIETVELTWDGQRWGVWAVTSSDGPAPMLAPSQTAADPATFVTALDGFSLVKQHN